MRVLLSLDSSLTLCARTQQARIHRPSMAMPTAFKDPGYVPQAHRDVPAGHTKMPRDAAIELDARIGDFEAFMKKTSTSALVQEFFVGGPFRAPVRVRVGDITTNEEARLGEIRFIELHHAEEVAKTLSRAGVWLPMDAVCAIKLVNGGYVAADGGHRAYAVRTRYWPRHC